MKYSKTFMRPHTDAEWYTPSDEFKAWVKKTYIDTGLLTEWRKREYTDSSELVMKETSTYVDGLGTDLEAEVLKQPWVDNLKAEKAWNEAWEIVCLNHGVED